MLDDRPKINRNSLMIWGKVLVTSVPAAVIGLILEDRIDTLFYNNITVSVALIVYGVLFILIEAQRHDSLPRTADIAQMPWSTAFVIGLHQVLALVPGTSRSGATILGAIAVGFCLPEKKRPYLSALGDDLHEHTTLVHKAN